MLKPNCMRGKKKEVNKNKIRPTYPSYRLKSLNKFTCITSSQVQ